MLCSATFHRKSTSFQQKSSWHTSRGSTDSHPGVELRANLKSISHRCYLWEFAFELELTKEIICLPLGCLQGGGPPRTKTEALELFSALSAPACCPPGTTSAGTPWHKQPPRGLRSVIPGGAHLAALPRRSVIGKRRHYESLSGSPRLENDTDPPQGPRDTPRLRSSWCPLRHAAPDNFLTRHCMADRRFPLAAAVQHRRFFRMRWR